uniref:Helicase-associated domain-containing protein n=1 Tax=Chaetoceros debilis TaxID=122233 RepID=A0A7S3Q795_9STRA
MVVMPTYQPQLVAVAPTLGYPQMVPSQTNPAIVALPPYAIDQTALCGIAPAPTFGHPGATYFTHPGSTMAHAMPATYFPGSQMQAYPTPAYPIMNSYPSPCLSSFPTNGALSLPPGAVGIHGQHHQQQVFNMNGSNQEIMYPTLSSQACNPTPSNTASQGNINTTNSQGNQTATKNKNSDDKDTAVDTYKKPPRRRRVVKRFEERFRDLMKFKDRYGHCDVPHKWKEDLSLGKWCSNIRISYKSVMKGDKPAIHILPGQIQRLNDEGFKWSFKRCV